MSEEYNLYEIPAYQLKTMANETAGVEEETEEATEENITTDTEEAKSETEETDVENAGEDIAGAETEETENDKAKQDHKKTGSQRLKEKLAAKEAEIERLKQQIQQPTAPTVQSPIKPANELDLEEPNIDTFQGTMVDFNKAYTVWAAKKALADERAKEQQVVASKSWSERMDAAKVKYPDFDEKLKEAIEDKLPYTPVFDEIVKTSDVGPEILHWITSNKEKVWEIAKLTPALQAKELGKIEDKLLSQKPITKKETAAKAPIKPLAGVSKISKGAKSSDYGELY